MQSLVSLSLLNTDSWFPPPPFRYTIPRWWIGSMGLTWSLLEGAYVAIRDLWLGFAGIAAVIACCVIALRCFFTIGVDVRDFAFCCIALQRR